MHDRCCRENPPWPCLLIGRLVDALETLNAPIDWTLPPRCEKRYPQGHYRCERAPHGENEPHYFTSRVFWGAGYVTTERAIVPVEAAVGR